MSPTVQAQLATLHPPDRVVAFIDLVKSLRWPVVAIFVLMLAHGPIRSLWELVPGMPAQAMAPRVVMAGTLPIKADPATLPAASDEVVQTLRALDGELLRVFLDMDQTAIYCGALEAEYRVGMRRLAHLGLVEARNEPERGAACAQNAVMTDHGKRVQTYIISLTVSLLKG
jgi:hypothetical protein